MSFYGYHGETEAERTLGNRFHVDVEIRMDLSIAGRSDDIADTLDYAHAFTLVRGVVEDQQYSLIEADRRPDRRKPARRAGSRRA